MKWKARGTEREGEIPPSFHTLVLLKGKREEKGRE